MLRLLRAKQWFCSRGRPPRLCAVYSIFQSRQMFFLIFFFGTLKMPGARCAFHRYMHINPSAASSMPIRNTRRSRVLITFPNKSKNNFIIWDFDLFFRRCDVLFAWTESKSHGCHLQREREGESKKKSYIENLADSDRSVYNISTVDVNIVCSLDWCRCRMPNRRDLESFSGKYHTAATISKCSRTKRACLPSSIHGESHNNGNK